jgi:ABC-type branched-subunit amino acid transport system substrate-binding protein
MGKSQIYSRQALATTLVGLLFFAQSAAGGTDKQIKIAIETVTSHSNDRDGQVRNGVRFAVDDFRPQFEELGYSLAWSYNIVSERDVQSVSTTVMDDPQVVGVIANAEGDVAKSIARSAGRRGLSLIFPLNRDDDISKLGFKSVFRLAGYDEEIISAGVEYIKSLGVKRLDLVVEKGTVWAKRAKRVRHFFERIFPSVKLTMRDFNVTVDTLRKTKPEMIYIIGDPERMGHFAKHLRENFIFTPLFSFSELDHEIWRKLPGGFKSITSPYLASAGGTAAANSFYVTPFGLVADYEISSQEQKILVKKYEPLLSRYGGPAYDATRMLLTAIAKSIRKKDLPLTRQRISQALHATRLHGLTGELSFNQRGDRATRKYYVYKYIPGRAHVFPYLDSIVHYPGSTGSCN